MAYPNDNSLMATQYLEAANAVNNDKLLEIARYNLIDPNLSRYYQIKNLLLVADNEQDWYERERCRRKLEKIWATTKELTARDDMTAQSAFEALREELDELHETLKHSAIENNIDPSELQEGQDDEDENEFDINDDDESVMSETERYGDDEAAVREAEKEAFGDDSNIISVYEQAAAAGRARRMAREAEQAREQAAASIQTPPLSSDV